MQPEARLACAQPDLTRLVEDSKSRGCSMVTIRDRIYHVLMHYGLAQIIWVACQVTGFHPWNRSLSGIAPSKVAQRVKKFGEHGFSFAECLRACSVKKNPNISGTRHERTNIDIAKQSNGQLADVIPGSLQQFSLTCNHSNQAVRAIDAEIDLVDSKFAPSGRVSKGLMSEKDPHGIGTALSNGIPWLQIDGIVEISNPLVIRIILEADNIPNEVADRDNTPALLLKCHNALMTVEATDPDSIVAAAVTTVQRSEGDDRKDDIHVYVEFAFDWGGGNIPFVLHEIDNYAKGLQQVRDVPPGVLQKLSKATIGGVKGGALLRGACVKVMINGLEKQMTTSEVSLMTQDKQKPYTTIVLEHMQHARSVQNLVTDPSLRAAFAKERDIMDIRLINHLLNRSKQFKTYNDIVRAFLEAINKHGILVTVPPPWVAALPSGHASADTSAKRTLPDQAGGQPSFDVVKAALEKGKCKEHSVCTHVTSKLEYRVLKITEKHVTFVGVQADTKMYKNALNLSIKPEDVFNTFSNFKAGAEQDMNALE